MLKEMLMTKAMLGDNGGGGGSSDSNVKMFFLYVADEDIDYDAYSDVYRLSESRTAEIADAFSNDIFPILVVFDAQQRILPISDVFYPVGWWMDSSLPSMGIAQGWICYMNNSSGETAVCSYDFAYGK